MPFEAAVSGFLHNFKKKVKRSGIHNSNKKKCRMKIKCLIIAKVVMKKNCRIEINI